MDTSTIMKELDSFKHLPYFKPLYTAFIKLQMQFMVDQLSQNTDEETIILSVDPSAGIVSKLTSELAAGFLDQHTDIKVQFYKHCYQNKLVNENIKNINKRKCAVDEALTHKKSKKVSQANHPDKIYNVKNQNTRVSSVSNLTNDCRTHGLHCGNIPENSKLEITDVKSVSNNEDNARSKLERKCSPTVNVPNGQKSDHKHIQTSTQPKYTQNSLKTWNTLNIVQSTNTQNSSHASNTQNDLLLSNTHTNEHLTGTHCNNVPCIMSEGNTELVIIKTEPDCDTEFTEENKTDDPTCTTITDISQDTENILNTNPQVIEFTSSENLVAKDTREFNESVEPSTDERTGCIVDVNPNDNMIAITNSTVNDFSESEANDTEAPRFDGDTNVPSDVNNVIKIENDIDYDDISGNQTKTSSNPTSNVVVTTADGRIKCNYCDQTFTFLSSKKRHERKHTGENPYICTTCHRTFYRKDDYSVHLYKHNYQKYFKCHVCLKVFNERKLLDRHFISSHTSCKLPTALEQFLD
ncbi:hypothetical protein ACF0H5_013795 [Mactra antiquata]